MQIHELKRNTKQKSKRRVGRGGKHGTTSGRGTKGQRARAGGKVRPVLRDIIKKIPKIRGYRVSAIKPRPDAVNVAQLETTFETGAEINIDTLIESGLVHKRGKRKPEVKILAKGDVSKKFTISGLKVSASAKEKIEKAGGKIVEVKAKANKDAK